MAMTMSEKSPTIVGPMPISSRAPQGEGSEVRSQDRRLQAEPKPQAPTEMWGEDMIRSSRKRLAVQRMLDGNVKVAPSGCWEWTGGKSHGYGQMRVREVWGVRPVYAHRAAAALKYGPLPKDIKVCHRCDNPKCCNPEHLFLGSQADNLKDMASKGRSALGERNGMSKLSDADVAAIRTAVAGGQTQRDVATKFGVSEGHMSAIVRSGGKRKTAEGQVRSRHGLAKLTEDQVIRMYALHDEGWTPTQLGAHFGVSDATANCIVKGRTWRHLFSERRKGSDLA